MDTNEAVQAVFSSTAFSTLDWCIVIGYVSISIFVGLFASRFIKGVSDYVVAGRNLGTALSVATMTGTENGSDYGHVCPPRRDSPAASRPFTSPPSRASSRLLWG